MLKHISEIKLLIVFFACVIFIFANIQLSAAWESAPSQGFYGEIVKANPCAFKYTRLASTGTPPDFDKTQTFSFILENETLKCVILRGNAYLTCSGIGNETTTVSGPQPDSSHLSCRTNMTIDCYDDRLIQRLENLAINLCRKLHKRQ